MSTRIRYGTGFKYGTGEVYGGRDSYTGAPCPASSDFSIDTSTSLTFAVTPGYLIHVTVGGLLQVRHGGSLTSLREIFYVEDSDGVWWKVTALGSDGSLTAADGTTEANPVGWRGYDSDGVLWKVQITTAGLLQTTTTGSIVGAITVEQANNVVYTTEGACS